MTHHKPYTPSPLYGSYGSLLSGGGFGRRMMMRNRKRQMKARIEKKLSKRLVQIAPSQFSRVWIDKDFSELAYAQGTRVSHVWSVGGGTDYWGDGEDAYTVWQDWRMTWDWAGDFDPYPSGHQFQHYPNTEGFRATTRTLLQLARECEARTK